MTCPAALPPPDLLERRWRAMAVLDALLCPEWDQRYHSFDARWAPGERLATMRDGSGDHMTAWFTAAGAVVRGFAHESDMARPVAQDEGPWDGLYEGLPPALSAFLDEPAFVVDEATFCLWWPAGATGWGRGPVELLDGPDPDGARKLLALFVEGAARYRTFAVRYFDRDLPLAAVEAVFAHRPLDAALQDRGARFGVVRLASNHSERALDLAPATPECACCARRARFARSAARRRRRRSLHLDLRSRRSFAAGDPPRGAPHPRGRDSRWFAYGEPPGIAPAHLGALAPGRSLAEVESELAEAGYPQARA
ncbi:MAG: hypothetical protein M9894_26475 [Planctomycetes bacterium]|nr:hypothetical protein [Planctomycetota bacterium]